MLASAVFSFPSVLVSIGHRVLKPARPSLLRRRARLLAAQAVLVFVASQGGPTNVKGSARLCGLAYRCGLGRIPAFLPLRRRASPSLRRRLSTSPCVPFGQESFACARCSPCLPTLRASAKATASGCASVHLPPHRIPHHQAKRAKASARIQRNVSLIRRGGRLTYLLHASVHVRWSSLVKEVLCLSLTQRSRAGYHGVKVLS
jgi:hypothetical protein